MTLKGRFQSVDACAQAGADQREVPQQFDFSGPWFTSKVAAAYVCSKTVRAFYTWRTRHFIVARSNGSVAKADLDRALKARKRKRVMAPASLLNLRRGVHVSHLRGVPAASAIAEKV